MSDAFSPTSRTLPIALLRAREAVMEHFRPMLQKHGITEQQWRVLRVIREAGETDASELARNACILAPSLSRILKTLEAADLITLRKDPADGRRALISLTAKSQAFINEVAPESAAIYAELERRAGKKNIAALMHPSVTSSSMKDDVKASVEKLLKNAFVPLGEKDGSLRFFSEKLNDVEQERAQLGRRGLGRRPVDIRCQGVLRHQGLASPSQRDAQKRTSAATMKYACSGLGGAGALVAAIAGTKARKSEPPVCRAICSSRSRLTPKDSDSAPELADASCPRAGSHRGMRCSSRSGSERISSPSAGSAPNRGTVRATSVPGERPGAK